MKMKGISSGTMLAVLAIGGLVVLAGTGTLSFGDDTGDDVETKDATLNLKASQLGSSSGISTTGYAVLEDDTVVTKSLSASQFTAWSNTFTNQMNNIEVGAFDSSNYPIFESVNFGGQTTVNKEVKTANIASGSDVSIEARETSGSSDNDDTVDIAAGGQATISSLRASVDVQDLYWNTGLVMVDTPDNSNVSVDMPNAEAVAVPDYAPSGVDEAYRAYDPSMGDDNFEEFAEHDSSRIVLEGDDSNDPAETVTFYVDDIQAYQDSETGSIEYGAEDDSGSSLGLAEQSLDVTVN
jgi:hypothetical protein